MTIRPLSLAALVLAAGCLGTVDDGAPDDTETSTSTPDPSSPTPPGTPGNQPPSMLPPSASGECQESAPEVTAARRLTREQYRNTVRDLLGAPAAAAADKLPADDLSDGLFVAPSTLLVTTTWASNAMAAAEEIAAAAISNLGSLVPCPATEGEACARKFIEAFGKRAYRRPLEGSERDGLLDVWKAGAGTSFAHGIELVLRAMLQSPSFLYRLELGQKSGSVAGAVKLTQHEIAARLSYGLWGSTPDDALARAADAGELATAEQIATHARRMVTDARARHTLAEFTGRWFGIDLLDEVMKDPAEYPAFDEKLVASMKANVAAYVEDVLSGDGRFATLLAAPHAHVDAATAPLYGVTGTGKVNLPGGKRFGLLTDVGIITAHTFADPSAPIHRGKFVRERLFCTDPPNPPADLMVEPPDPRAGVPTRERLKEHVDVPACKGCHEFMDPIGHAFGNFDGLGRWRDQDAGKPVDATGYLAFTDVDGAFDGVGQLVTKLLASGQVQDCVAGTFLRFASGTESKIGDCAQSKLRAAFTASKGDLRELIVAIARTDAFRYRRTIPGEVLP